MTYLIAGLLLFLGVHSVRIVAEDWRLRQQARFGTGLWRSAFALLAALGLLLMVWGYGLTREMPVQVWAPPRGMRHAAALLTLPAFILLASAYVPANHLRARLRHPMVLAVKLWALAHLLANGHLNQMVLFGSFLIWAVLNFRAARRRDGSTPAQPPRRGATVVSVLLGTALWLAFTLWLHGLLIGVRPMG